MGPKRTARQIDVFNILQKSLNTSVHLKVDDAIESRTRK